MLRKKLTTLFLVLAISTVLSVGCGLTNKADTATPAEALQDGLVTSAVRLRLAKQAVSSKIDVETRHGDVTLTGTVATPAECDRVIDSALSVAGVKTLSPNLTVE